MRPGSAAAVALLAVLAGCASASRPANVENACAIFDDRPDWRRALERSEAKWGAPASVQLAIIWKESAFEADAQPGRTYFLGIIPTGRRSSAYGYSQALDGTWEWYVRETGNSGADRDDFEDAADFIGWYMARTARVNGISMRDAYNQYLAYHEGHAGYRSGAWKGKRWLRRVASDVDRKAASYAAQMRRCA